MTTISIHLLGDTREFQAEELPPVTSAHTGRQLRRVALEFRVPSKRQDELDAELKAAAEKDGRPLRGTDVNWSVSNTRYSYTVGAQPDVATYSLELQEAEDLRASAVEIGGLALVPGAYREWIDGEGDYLVLTFVTETAGEANQQLEELVIARGETYYDVIRRGVSDTPVRMRFGRTLWQETEAGSIRHNLSLVADEGRETSKPGPFALLNEPQLSRTTEAAVANAQALAVLVDELQAQGVLSSEAADKIRAAALPHKITKQEARQFTRAYDLDMYGD
ncbi:hypothetical protein [Streptomyces sp. B21-083]|uniref:hypothetical protein n=1 Tax=Streptomyces sp. B21-083 TaxID=3039410 RepID=UPI002FF02C26